PVLAQADGGQGVRGGLPGHGGGLGQARRPGGQAGRLPQESAAVLGGQWGLSGFGGARAHRGLSEKEGVGTTPYVVSGYPRRWGRCKEKQARGVISFRPSEAKAGQGSTIPRSPL